VCTPFSVLRSLFSVLRSLFSVLRSPFSILHSPFSVLHSPFSLLRSPFSVSVLGQSFSSSVLWTSPLSLSLTSTSLPSQLHASVLRSPSFFLHSPFSFLGSSFSALHILATSMTSHSFNSASAQSPRSDAAGSPHPVANFAAGGYSMDDHDEHRPIVLLFPPHRSPDDASDVMAAAQQEEPLSPVQQALTIFTTREDFMVHCAARYGAETKVQLADRIRAWASYHRPELDEDMSRRHPAVQTRNKRKWKRDYHSFVYERYRQQKLQLASAHPPQPRDCPVPVPFEADALSSAAADENVDPLPGPSSSASVSLVSCEQHQRQHTSRQSSTPLRPFRRQQRHGPPSALLSPSNESVVSAASTTTSPSSSFYASSNHLIEAFLTAK
jgi:hypothetical protein